jgi:hypothetical protein
MIRVGDTYDMCSTTMHPVGRLCNRPSDAKFEFFGILHEPIADLTLL